MRLTKESFFAPDARILVVDDTRMNLIVMEGLLKKTGMQIDTADSGKECLFLAERSRYHIIFLDIRMPEMDGTETLRRLLTMEGNKNIPIIALTANNSSEEGKEYINEGFSDYLSKPVDAEKLEKIIQKYLPKDLEMETMAEERDTHVSDNGTEKMPDIAGLDPLTGIQSCGTAETFQQALKEFYITAKDRIQEIENYVQTENYNNYTIKVHALKSSALLIGAKKLSEMARYLEECADHENIPEIKLKTVELTEHFRELAKAIGAYINEKADNHNRPAIELEPLMDALHTIYEFVEAFDFDSADSIMQMLDEYAIPDIYSEAIQKLKVLLIDADREGIMQHITTMEELAQEPLEYDSIDIPNIDAKTALAALGGSVERYINILKVFTEDEQERLTQMDECIKTENLKLYTVYAHSLKSSSAIIGSMELSKLAEKLETAGKGGDLKYIRENHNEFSIKTKQIIEDLLYYLQQCSNLELEEKEQGCKEILLDNMTKIEAALTEYEIDAAKEALNQLINMQWSQAISVMLSDIDQKIRNFDYEDALILVSKLLKMKGDEL